MNLDDVINRLLDLRTAHGGTTRVMFENQEFAGALEDVRNVDIRAIDENDVEWGDADLADLDQPVIAIS